MNTKSNQNDSLIMLLQRELTLLHGPLMTGEHLRAALGYPSGAAFRQAIVRKNIPIPVFSIENRRGKFALTKDVVIWVVLQRERAIAKSAQ